MLELGAPAQTALMAQFEKLSGLSQFPGGYEHAMDEKTRRGEFLYEVMLFIGKELIDYAEKYGAGWAILRTNEGEKAFDFNRVANDPRIAFARKSGFIAKTRERVVGSNERD